MSVAAASPPARIDLPEASCPYRGLAPFSERDAEFFFGRAAEREIIAANLIASPLTLLYSASGVGKSSVLRAGVVHDLVESARASSEAGYGPEYIPAVVREWRQAPLAALSRALSDGVREVLGDDAVADPVEADSAAGEIDAWAERTGATMLVILDQFEEFLLYHGEAWGEREPAAQLAAALSVQGDSASFLLALREDSLAGLDRFKGRVPGLFDNYLRLHQLSVEEGARAITGPIDRWNERHPEDPMHVEPALEREVLRQVGDGRLALAGAGQGQPTGASAAGIEAPFLQLVLTKVWDAERAAKSELLRLETLENLGGARKIVATYLDDQMARLSTQECDVASEVFHQLVTPSGAKVARSVRDLTAYTGASEAALDDVLGKLSQGEEWRILRPELDPRDGTVSYEIFHDVLAEPVLDWRARHEAARAGRLALEKGRRRTRRAIALGALGALVIAALVVLGVLYLLSARDQKRASARAQHASEVARVRADADAIVSSSRIALASDPELSVLLAQAALRLTPRDAGAKSALRAALGDDRSLGVLPGHAKATYAYAELTRDGSLAAVSSLTDRLRVWSVADRTLLYTTPIRFGVASFNPAGTRVAVPERHGRVTVRDALTGHVLTKLERSSSTNRFGWSPDGTRLAGVCPAGMCVWTVRNGRLANQVRFPGPLDAVAWPSSRRIAMIGFNEARLIDLEGGRIVRRLKYSFATANVISGDAGTAVIGEFRGSIVWNLRTGAARRLFGNSSDEVVALDRHGRTAMTSGYDGRVRIWDTRTGRLSTILNGHSGIVSRGWLSDDGRVGATGSDDRTARVWDIATGTQLAVLGGHPAAIADIAVTESGIALTADMEGGARLWRIWPRTGATLDEAGTRLRSAELDEQGGTTVASSDKGVRVWDSHPGAAAAPRHLGGDAPVKQATLSPDRQSVLIVGRRLPAETAFRARVVRLSDGARIGPPVGVDYPHDLVNAATFSPDGSLIVTAQRDGAAWLWSAGDHRLLRELGSSGKPSPAREVRDAAFSADSKLVVTGGAGSAVRLYDASSGKQVQAFPLPKQSSNGLFDDPGSVRGVRAVALQPGGRLVAAGDRDGFVRLWDRRDPRAQRVLTLGQGVNDLAFSPDGELLATASGAKAQLWDVSTGQSVSVVTHGTDSVTGVGFSRDGRSMVVSADGRIRVFDCELCGTVAHLRDLAKQRVRRVLTTAERVTYLPKDQR